MPFGRAYQGFSGNFGGFRRPGGVSLNYAPQVQQIGDPSNQLNLEAMLQAIKVPTAVAPSGPAGPGVPAGSGYVPHNVAGTTMSGPPQFITGPDGKQVYNPAYDNFMAQQYQSAWSGGGTM